MQCVGIFCKKDVWKEAYGPSTVCPWRKTLCLPKTRVYKTPQDRSKSDDVLSFLYGLSEIVWCSRKEGVYMKGSIVMVAKNNSLNDAKDADAVHKLVDEVVRIQQSVIAMLPVAGVDGCVKAITALCMGLASVDDIHIHKVDRAARSGVSEGGDSAPVRGIFSSSVQAAEEPSEDPLMQTMLSGRSRYIDRGTEAPMVGHHFSEMHDRIKAIYVVPLVAQARVVGVLRAGTFNPEGIHEEIRMVLDLLAPTFALLIENALLYQQLKVQVVGGQHKQEQLAPEEPSVSSGDLVARLAHEIKNPLTAISTFMQLVPKKWNDDHFRTSFYPIARDETQRLGRLVNDMLDRGKKQPARLMPVDIQELVNNLLALVAPLAEQRHLRFQTLLCPGVICHSN